MSMPVKKTASKRGTNHLDQEFGQRLRLLRIEREMTQTDIGRHLGVSFQQIQKYERGTNRISASRLIDMCKLLKTTPNDLMAWDGKIAVMPIDVETYKLARAFSDLPPHLKPAIRTLINSMINNA
jgi:transcriptional regulator with XRE-family HTH domain